MTRITAVTQDRLPKELALRGITTIEAANCYIMETYVPRHNKQFCVKPASDKSAFTPWISTMPLADVLCVQTDRAVQLDNTVRYNSFVLQIPKNEYRYSYAKTEVKVHEYLDHQLAIFYGPLCIGRYDADGKLKDETDKTTEASYDKKYARAA